MAGKFLSGKLLTLKVPSVATVSTTLTYAALTGTIVLPALTGPLPVQQAIARPVDPLPAPAAPTAVATTTAAPTRAIPAAPDNVIAAAVTSSEARSTAREVTPLAKAAPVEAMPAAPVEVPVQDVQLSEPAPEPDSEPIVEAKVRQRSAKQRARDRDRAETKRSKKAAKDDADKAKDDAKGDQDSKEATKAEEEHHSHDGKDGDKPDNKKSDAKSDVPVDGKDPPVPVVWSDAEIAAGLKECLRVLAPIAIEVEASAAMRSGECGTPAPIMVKSIGTNPKIVFQPAAEMNCPMAAALDKWAKETLQPAAREVLGTDVTRVVGSSGYSCRNRYGLANEKLSEHALANAIDIAGFGLANGRVIKLTGGWGKTERDRVAEARAAKEAKAAEKDAKNKADDKKKPADIPVIKSDKAATKASLKAEELREAKAKDAKAKKGRKGQDEKEPEVVVVETSSTDGDKPTADGRFLRRLHEGACSTFGTVLGPEANEAHRDHFHFDLRARKRRAVCR